MQNSQTNYGLEEAGMADMDDNIGTLLKHLDDIGEADNTIVIFTTDNGAEVFTWPDGGMTPFKDTKGTVCEGGFRVPCIARWPGHIKPGTVENGIFSGLDWFPTFMAAAGNPNITDQLPQGREARRPDLQEPSRRLQPDGLAGRQGTIGATRTVLLRWGPISEPFAFDDFKFQFWRFVFVQQVVGKELQTFIDYPPMQKGASFNLEAVKAEMAKKMQQAEAASKGPVQ